MDLKEQQTDLPVSESSFFGTLGSVEAAELLEIPKRRVLYYAEKGFVKPSIGAMGKGHARKFDLHGLIQISIIIQLERFGIAPRFISEMMEAVDYTSRPNEEFESNVVLMVQREGDQFTASAALAEYIEICRTASSLIAINLYVLQEDIKHKLKLFHTFRRR